MGVKLKQTGSLRATKEFFKRATRPIALNILNKYGYEGVAALYEATPKRTGKTASSWSFEIEQRQDVIAIVWRNSNVVQGNSIALLIQYGHGTGRGTYVEGVDYINPALAPVFERMAESLWMEVTGDNAKHG